MATTLTKEYEQILAKWVVRDDNSYNDLVELLNECRTHGMDMVHPVVVCCVEQLHYRVSVQIGPPMRPEISFRNSLMNLLT